MKARLYKYMCITIAAASNPHNNNFKSEGGLGGQVVSVLGSSGISWVQICSGRDNFQIIRTPSSYSTWPRFSEKWTGLRLVTDSGTKCAWVIHESKAVHNNCRCLCEPRVSGSVKNPHNNNNFISDLQQIL